MLLLPRLRDSALVDSSPSRKVISRESSGAEDDALGLGALKYWRDGDRSLIEFFKTDEGKQSKCGDVHLAVADASQEGQLPDRNDLIQFVKDLRGALPSTGTDAAWAGHFVALVEVHLLFALAPEYGPLGISFDAVFDKAGWSEVFDVVVDTRRHFAAYYPDIPFKVDVRLDYSLDDRQVVDEIMRKADHVSVTTFASHRFDLVDMYRAFLTSTCPHCNDERFRDYKAKVTFVATGDCTAPCGTTMCDDYAFVVPSNIVTAPIQLLASINIARGHVIGQDRFDYFLEANGTLIGLDHFEESRCIYGDDVLAAIGAPLCGATAIKHSQACS
ncbi:hypothetical protein FOZ60_006489 [Perkinsus olseni]|uniref:Uncharacterized protein n=1 Tax=Perkinsus olseni TaxID=32597 RepID=A0A7J6NR19_PEROL|nr:hypothetical protein FOZ60_006489 [Perkinsus olseni]